jgi:hypothetical protein
MVGGFLKVLNILDIIVYGIMDGKVLLSVQAFLVLNTSVVFLHGLRINV